MQAKKWSAIEITVGLLIGLLSSIFIFQPIIFGFYGIDFGHTTNTVIAIWFTVISFGRSYLVRRMFNWIHIKYHMKEVK